jgi:hypothetical protein
MAFNSVNIKLGQSLGDGRYATSIQGSGVPDFATVTANVATLVADGATPTQAHVNTLNTNYTPTVAAITGDVSIVWDATKVTDLNHLRAALDAALFHAKSGYGGLHE